MGYLSADYSYNHAAWAHSVVDILVIISDTHCGSDVALCPPDFETAKGNVIKQNPVQQWFWDCWRDFWDQYVPSVVGSDPFSVCVNGDLVEGNHHRTDELVVPGEHDHIKMAVEVFRPITERATHFFITEGTQAHTKWFENIIGKDLGAFRDEGGNHVFESLHLRINECPGVVRHHITTTSRPYLEASQFSIHMGVERIESARNQHILPVWFARAHRHRVGGFFDSNGLMVITPAWQADTRYVRKVASASLPNPGGIILDWRGRPRGAMPLVHPPKVYYPKQPAYVTV